MTIDLAYDDIDAELASSIRRFCDDRLAGESDRLPEDAAGRPLPDGWWSGLAELGVLGLGTAEGGGSVTTIAAAMEELGRADAPGPLVGTFFALQLLDEDERSPIARGEYLVAVANGPVAGWLPDADTVIEVDGATAHLVRPRGEIERVGTLGGEPSGRCEFERVRDLGDHSSATAVVDVALAAYLVGEGEHLLHGVTDYAADRVQFKKPIGSFQAVAHPLADSFIELSAARTLVRTAAHALTSGAPGAAAIAATARMSAVHAAMNAAFRSHQTYGAMGFTVEGPIGYRSARIRQLSFFPAGRTSAVDSVLASHGL